MSLKWPSDLQQEKNWATQNIHFFVLFFIETFFFVNYKSLHSMCFLFLVIKYVGNYVFKTHTIQQQ